MDDNIYLIKEKILALDYTMPNDICPQAKDLIKKVLCLIPHKRIDLQEIGEHPFFTKNRIPDYLPECSMFQAPSQEFIDTNSKEVSKKRRFTLSPVMLKQQQLKWNKHISEISMPKLDVSKSPEVSDKILSFHV